MFLKLQMIYVKTNVKILIVIKITRVENVIVKSYSHFIMTI